MKKLKKWFAYVRLTEQMVAGPNATMKDYFRVDAGDRHITDTSEEVYTVLAEFISAYCLANSLYITRKKHISSTEYVPWTLRSAHMGLSPWWPYQTLSLRINQYTLRSLNSGSNSIWSSSEQRHSYSNRDSSSICSSAALKLVSVISVITSLEGLCS